MLGTLAFRILVGAATAYIASLAILFAFQSRFIYPAPQEPAPLTPGYEQVELTTEDGLTLRAFYQEAAPGMPTVLYFHGNGGTLQGASVSNAALVEAGIGALLVEYRGYGGNPGSPSEQGLYSDGEAALNWLNSRGVAASDLVVVGNSIGGGVAVHIAGALTDKATPPAALILVAPFRSLPDVAAEKLWWFPARLLARDQFDNRGKIGELALPVLIQHGDADTLIDDSHGKALAAAARDARFQPFAGSGHSLSFERRSQEARRDWILALQR
ncbi:alpha/beta hydrolase [uncultured Erythrobacter sp.]|uniref:alpha/beta hydrolase n=1 Tax=uncultured Erythrobacter sp. TaxID=263913 RepID=UPI0026390AE3|nr:alpha/beta hydrolase [uncultured Erythrobacter sp.]